MNLTRSIQSSDLLDKGFCYCDYINHQWPLLALQRQIVKELLCTLYRLRLNSQGGIAGTDHKPIFFFLASILADPYKA